jgi:glycosyltransferase involved in cell wall biosynthesis
MRILLVTGSVPPAACGVGHYTVRLADALREVGVRAEVLTGVDWTSRGAARLNSTLNGSGDLVHIQYPSVGYGHHLGPQVLSMLRQTIVTIHEFGHVRVPRRLATLPFFLRSRHLIFTSEAELNTVANVVPGVTSKSSVIAIGSNIEPVRTPVPRRPDRVLYFGLISPRKGLESVLNLAEILQRRHSRIRIQIVGALSQEHQGYAEEFLRRTAGLPIDCHIDLPEEKVAHQLAEAGIGYLPFPDGASDRRGSLKAALASGLPCVTTSGDATPSGLASFVRFASTPEQAWPVIEHLAENQPVREEMSLAGIRYAQQFEWRSIAMKHKDIYETVARRRRT